MFKAMIVDDDILAREKLKRLLEEQEVLVCAEAVNGHSALAMLEGMQPDILFIDVKMPVMDGVELSERVAAGYPHIKMVMLSSYDDFDYVRASLRNGAFDYILKHRLDKEAVEAQLQRLADELAHRSRLDEMSRASTREPLLSAMAKKEFLRGLLTGAPGAAVPLEEALNLRIVPVNLYVEVMRLSRPEGTPAPENLHRVLHSVATLCDQLLEEKGIGEIVQLEGCEFALLLSFAGLYSEAEVRQKKEGLLAELQNLVHKYFNMQATFQSSGPLGSYEQVAAFYRQLSAPAQPEPLPEEESGMNPYVRQVLHFIRHNYGSDISLTDAANLVEVSPNYLSKLFKTDTGKSFVEYLNRVRIDKAKLLLAKRELSVKKIAAQVGYANYNYFFRVFKELEGMTPAKYTQKDGL